MTMRNSTANTQDRYGRIDIQQTEIAGGLRQVFVRLDQRFGPFDYETIIQDYTPLICQGLGRDGFCRVQRLNLNGVTVDMDIFFQIDRSPAALIIDTFIEGDELPAFSMVNGYHIVSE